MKTRFAAAMALASYAGLWLGWAKPLRAQEQGGANAVNAAAVGWLRYLAEEIRNLRVEVSELRLAIEEARIPDLQRGVLASQAERQRLEAETVAHAEEIKSLDSQLLQPGLSAEELQQLMTRKAELANELNGRLRTRAEALAADEAGARERVQAQQGRIEAALAHRTELITAYSNR